MYNSFMRQRSKKTKGYNCLRQYRVTLVNIFQEYSQAIRRNFDVSLLLAKRLIYFILKQGTSIETKLDLLSGLR